MEVTVKAQRKETLFDDVAARNRTVKTMAVMDSIKCVWGRGKLRCGATGSSKRWAMRCENRSLRNTTQWDELRSATQAPPKKSPKMPGNISAERCAI